MRRSTFSLVGFASLLACATLGSGIVASASVGGDVTATVDGLLPGSISSLQSPSSVTSGGPQQLLIQLSPTEIRSGLSTMAQTFTYNEIGWRARSAASVVAETNPNVTSYSVVASDGSVPPGAFNAFHGGFATIGTPISTPNLDSVSSSLALAQLNSNLTVLNSVLPSGSVISESATVLPVGSSADQFALEADITINQPSALVGHYGDVLDGLTTGLTGDPSLTSIEGLSIVVNATDGTPILGSWQATRSETGTLQFGDPTQSVNALQVTTTFPNLTGGPATEQTALGAPIVSSKAKSAITGSVRKSSSNQPVVTSKSFIVASQVQTRHGGDTQAWWWASSLGALILLFGLVGWRRFRPQRDS